MVIIESRSAGPEDVIRLARAGRCYIVQTTFIHGEKGRDGRAHNYWVYHLLEVDGNQVRISRRSRLFPKWVWYTHKENHKETTQLTAEQKRRLWHDYVKREARVRDPKRERFRREQGIFCHPILSRSGRETRHPRGSTGMPLSVSSLPLAALKHPRLSVCPSVPVAR